MEIAGSLDEDDILSEATVLSGVAGGGAVMGAAGQLTIANLNERSVTRGVGADESEEVCRWLTKIEAAKQRRSQGTAKLNDRNE